MEDPVEVQLPSGDRPCIVLRVEKLRDRIPPAPFGDVPLYFCNSPVIESTVGGGMRNVYIWFGLQRQLIYRIACRLAELIQPSPVHSPVESSANICAGQSGFDVVQFVERGVLTIREPGRFDCRREGDVL